MVKTTSKRPAKATSKRPAKATSKRPAKATSKRPAKTASKRPAKTASKTGNPQRPRRKGRSNVSFSSTIGNAARQILPIMDPAFNMREILKQMILLEDHLVQTEKRCRDCINKHFLAIEALAEEAITLSSPARKNCPLELDSLVGTVRGLHHRYGHTIGNREEMLCIASELRTLRKSLMPKYALLPVEMLPHAESIAARHRGPPQKKNV